MTYVSNNPNNPFVRPAPPTRRPESPETPPQYGRHEFDRLYDPTAPVTLPPYSTIADTGEITHRPVRRTGTGDNINAFPVASTIQAAVAYSTNSFGRPLGNGNFQNANPPIQASVLQFQNSALFSDVRRESIQAYYEKYAMPIGIAHQLEDLVGYRFEFVLDDHPDTTIAEFTQMRKDILKRIELLQHIPNAGIVIRTASNFNNPKTFEADEKHSSRILDAADTYLSRQSIAIFNDELLQKAYEAVIGDAVVRKDQTVVDNAVADKSKTVGSKAAEDKKEAVAGEAVVDKKKSIAYVFTARDMSGQSSTARRYGNQMPLTNSARIAAKNLTKAVVNRPPGLVPTAFYSTSKNPNSNEIFDRLDSISENVGVISSFEQEARSITNGQSEYFPYSEGTHIQASILSPINHFWDQIDEGVIFSKHDLESHLGIPLAEVEYDKYYNKALDRQARLFTDKEAAEEKKKKSACTINLPAATTFGFAVSTNDARLQSVPHLKKRLEEFRAHPDWSPEVEEGINRLCAAKKIPIGMGLRLVKLAGMHHEINIDNSGSMILRADQENENQSHLRREAGGGIYDPDEHKHPSRMKEAKDLVELAGEYLSFIPNKGVTLSTLGNRRGDPVDDFYTLPQTNAEDFIRNIRRYLAGVRPSVGSTPLNQASKNLYGRANGRTEPTNTIILTDGKPTDNSPTYSTYVPHDRTVAADRSVREFIKNLTNRDSENIPVTIAQCTNNSDAIAWTNMTDNVCRNVNAIDDKTNEIAQVRSKHGNSFPYDRNIYVLALLMGAHDKLFDKLDEDGIFHKEELEDLLGREMSPNEYDKYYSQAYALQCDPGSENMESQSIAKISDWKTKASRPRNSNVQSSTADRMARLGGSSSSPSRAGMSSVGGSSSSPSRAGMSSVGGSSSSTPRGGDSARDVEQDQSMASAAPSTERPKKFSFRRLLGIKKKSRI